MAMVYVQGDETTESITQTIITGEKQLGIHPWCGICGSTVLSFEDQSTKFSTIEQIQPHLEQLEAANFETMLLFSKLPKPN